MAAAPQPASLLGRPWVWTTGVRGPCPRTWPRVCLGDSAGVVWFRAYLSRDLTCPERIPRARGEKTPPGRVPFSVKGKVTVRRRDYRTAPRWVCGAGQGHANAASMHSEPPMLVVLPVISPLTKPGFVRYANPGGPLLCPTTPWRPEVLINLGRRGPTGGVLALSAKLTGGCFGRKDGFQPASI